MAKGETDGLWEFCEWESLASLGSWTLLFGSDSQNTLF